MEPDLLAGALTRVEYAARVSHRSEDETSANTEKFIRAVVLSHGDWSVVEHVSASVEFLVDRGITHEIVRHRIASYTQESTRFVNYAKKMPPTFIYPNLSLSLVGHIRGGLSQVVVVFSMFFSEMSGSTTADVAVMSRALGGPMRREGYSPDFIAAIIAAASTIAALVPPSITAVVYGAVGNVSIAGLFMAGVVPGFMIGFGLMIYCYFFGPVGARKPRASMRQVIFATGDAALPLMIPVILLGGILTGWFTPTEAGVVAVIWIIAVVIPALNRGHFRKIPYDFCLAGLIFSLPLITIGAANAFGWMLAYLRGAIVIADWITSIAGKDPQYMMLLLVLLFTVIGDFIEPVPTIIIFMPLVNTLTQAGDINGVHMGVVLIATLAFGLITPPYGLVLLMASKFVGVPFSKALASGAADLRRVSRHHHLHDLFPQGGAVAAQARDP